MREDRLLEPLQLRSRTHAELGVERQHRVAVRIERLPLATCAVEGQHQLGAKALAQRIPGDEPLELADELRPAAKRELGLDPVLDGAGPQLFETGDLGWREGLQ